MEHSIGGVIESMAFGTNQSNSFKIPRTRSAHISETLFTIPVTQRGMNQLRQPSRTKATLNSIILVNSLAYVRPKYKTISPFRTQLTLTTQGELTAAKLSFYILQQS